jgi:hypothetical protein
LTKNEKTDKIPRLVKIIHPIKANPLKGGDAKLRV